MYRLRQHFSIPAIILVGLLTLSGCATKKYVRYQVGTLEPKIAENTKAIAETSERVDAVDRRAQQGISAAGVADQKATAALEAIGASDSKVAAANRAADAANQSAKQTNSRMDSYESRMAALDSYTVENTQPIVFKVNSSTLSDQGKQKLDSVVSAVAGQQGGYQIEIQGFTDTSGSEAYNISLSERRAETVLRYLVAKGLPLHRATLLGLGEERPVAANSFREGREQNRRVEVRVLRIAAK